MHSTGCNEHTEFNCGDFAQSLRSHVPSRLRQYLYTLIRCFWIA